MMNTTIVVLAVLGAIGYVAWRLFDRIVLNDPVAVALRSNAMRMFTQLDPVPEERDERQERERALNSLEKDLEQARRLMELEAKAWRLRKHYKMTGQDSPYSDEAKEMLRKIFEDIECMKNGG